MTDHAYTDDDLRAEAARQHAALTDDPEFMCVGESMEDRYVDSTVTEPDSGERTGSTWSELLPYNHDDGNAYNRAQRKIHDLINGAADVSDWAVNLGADELEPDEHRFTLNAGPKPIIRVHFAFASEMSDEARGAFVQGLGAAAAREMQLALDENPSPTISAEAAAHVLWTEQKGGWPPSTFATKLLNLWTSADAVNAEHLGVAFPEYAAAIALMRSGEQGIEQLKGIAEADR